MSDETLSTLIERACQILDAECSETLAAEIRSRLRTHVLIPLVSDTIHCLDADGNSWVIEVRQDTP